MANEYVVYRMASEPESTPAPMLRATVAPYLFPLSEEDKQELEELSASYDRETRCAGLAAPQLGVSKRAIVFAAPPGDEELRKWRKDFTQGMEKTVWVNPVLTAVRTGEPITDDSEQSRLPPLAGVSYTPAEMQAAILAGDAVEDYEGCFSVEGYAGAVPRWKRIAYTAVLPTGEEVNGELEGYLARIVQHEVDHLDGVLFTDRATKLLPVEEYRAMRAAIAAADEK